MIQTSAFSPTTHINWRENFWYVVFSYPAFPTVKMVILGCFILRNANGKFNTRCAISGFLLDAPKHRSCYCKHLLLEETFCSKPLLGLLPYQLLNVFWIQLSPSLLKSGSAALQSISILSSEDRRRRCTSQFGSVLQLHSVLPHRLDRNRKSCSNANCRELL